jgi:hypothetical protein
MSGKQKTRMTDGRTDGKTDGHAESSIPPNFVAGGIIMDHLKLIQCLHWISLN